MRVIYQYPGTGTPLSPLPRPEKSSGETVIIISSEKKPDRASPGGLSFSGDGYDVQISREALERNGEVRRHEEAHRAALGSAAASGILYDTQRGPGGEAIAVGGRIAVDLSEVPGDPAATLSKARTVITAAYAAASPSAGDMRTAAQAYRLAGLAQDQLNRERLERKIDILG